MNWKYWPRSCLLFALIAVIPNAIGFLGPQPLSKPEKSKAATEKPPPDEEPEELPKLLPKQPLHAAVNDDELRKLKIARFNEAYEELKRFLTEIGLTSGTPRVLRPNFELLFDAGKRLLEARLEISQNAKEDLEIREEYIEILKISKDWIQLRVKKGQEEDSLLNKSQYMGLDGQIHLLKAKLNQSGENKGPSEKASEGELNKFAQLITKESLKPGANDDELRKLLIARYNQAREEIQNLTKEIDSTKSEKGDKRPNTELLFDVSVRLLKSRLELGTHAKEEIAIRDEYLKLLKASEKEIEERLDKGEESSSLLHKVRGLCLDAEIQLLKAKKKQKK